MGAVGTWVHADPPLATGSVAALALSGVAVIAVTMSVASATAARRDVLTREVRAVTFDECRGVPTFAGAVSVFFTVMVWATTAFTARARAAIHQTRLRSEFK